MWTYIRNEATFPFTAATVRRTPAAATASAAAAPKKHAFSRLHRFVFFFYATLRFIRCRMGWEEFGNAYLPMAAARHIWFLNCFRTNDPLSSACCCWVSHCLPCEFYTCWCWRCGRQRQNKHIIKYGRVSMSLCHSSQTRSHPALFLCHSCDLITLWWHFMSASHDLDGVIVEQAANKSSCFSAIRSRSAPYAASSLWDTNWNQFIMAQSICQSCQMNFVAYWPMPNRLNFVQNAHNIVEDPYLNTRQRL